MVLRYTTYREVWNDRREDYESYEDGEIEYEIDPSEVREALAHILLEMFIPDHILRAIDSKDRQDIEQRIRGFLSDYDLDETLSDDFEGQIKDYFYDEAMSK